MGELADEGLGRLGLAVQALGAELAQAAQGVPLAGDVDRRWLPMQGALGFAVQPVAFEVDQALAFVQQAVHVARAVQQRFDCTFDVARGRIVRHQALTKQAWIRQHLNSIASRDSLNV